MLKLLLCYFLFYFVFCLPAQLFEAPNSTILLSKDGHLLNARIADDSQWRFPAPDSVPQKFKACLIAFEDHDFYHHFGISFKAIGRAMMSNFRASEIVSGGSTITMQIARMSRDKNRTYWQKLIEMIWAVRLETKYSKETLLRIYAAHAPFGGNIVGLEAASWRYYGLPPYKLSWSQCATLAVLPNAPGLVHPGKNRKKLLAKRNRVLKRLYVVGKIDAVTYELALEEPLIGAPKDLPNLAEQLITKAIKSGKKGQRIQTTIDYYKQQELSEVIARHQQLLNEKFIHNTAVIVVDLHTNEVITYIGNAAQENQHQKYVDCAQSPRSTGSILKPFLYASMLQEGMITSTMLIPDIPMHFDHFAPQNYNKKYSGAVPTKNALSQSLNVPAVYLLQKYGIKRFLHKLKQLKQHYINQSSKYYGLSLILGGAETSLWDLANAYAGMAKTLNYYNETNFYNSKTWSDIRLYPGSNLLNFKNSKHAEILDAGGIFEVFEAMLDVNRPRMSSSWRKYASSVKIAWKTGTSYGNRDAWAVGCTPDYVVAVWVGNATGEGRPFLIGATAAGPIMFDVFARLDRKKSWFDTPFDELEKVVICKESGYKCGDLCSKTDTVLLHRNALNTPICSFHEAIFTDVDQDFRYFQNCASDKILVQDTFFVLPPSQAYFYQKNHPSYQSIPPLSPECAGYGNQNTFKILYPIHNSELISTIGLNGKPQGIVFIASNPNPNAVLYWHVDEQFLGETTDEHRIKYFPTKGKHLLTVVDELGRTKKIWFTILE